MDQQILFILRPDTYCLYSYCHSEINSFIKASAITKLVPLFDRILVQRFAKEAATKSGILLPEDTANKVLNATVVAVGPGARTSTGDVIPCSVKAGDVVLLPEYGGNKIKIDKVEYFLFRDSEILGKWNQ